MRKPDELFTSVTNTNHDEWSILAEPGLFHLQVKAKIWRWATPGSRLFLAHTVTEENKIKKVNPTHFEFSVAVCSSQADCTKRN